MRDISLHLMDIAQNSITAEGKNIDITFSACGDSLLFTIKDDGKGMSEEMVKDVFSPFTTTRTTRRVGLGLPLLAESCEMTGGCAKISSVLKQGTTLTAQFNINHIDRIPLGDVGFTMATLMCSNETINFTLTLKNENEAFCVSTKELIKTLGQDTSLNQIEVISWLEEYINENIKIIFGGILNEIVS